MAMTKDDRSTDKAKSEPETTVVEHEELRLHRLAARHVNYSSVDEQIAAIAVALEDGSLPRDDASIEVWLAKRVEADPMLRPGVVDIYDDGHMRQTYEEKAAALAAPKRAIPVYTLCLKAFTLPNGNPAQCQKLAGHQEEGIACGGGFAEEFAEAYAKALNADHEEQDEPDSVIP
jgi:hypothetical protein